jgi:hypothetical protein
MRRQVAADIRDIFNAPDDIEARRLIERLVKRYTKSAPRLASWAREALPEGLAVYCPAGRPSPPPAHHQRPGRAQQGNPTTHPRGDLVPERGGVPAAGDGYRHGDLGRVAHRAR